MEGSCTNVIHSVAHGDEYVASSRQMLMSEGMVIGKTMCRWPGPIPTQPGDLPVGHNLKI